MFISYNGKPHIRNKIRCDLCEKEYYIIPGKNEPLEDLLISQEFFHIRHSGGYMSSFGDMSSLKLDICDPCFKEMLLNKMSEEKLSSFIT
jgi:hypothetical protein